jgi:hypothetical protein
MALMLLRGYAGVMGMVLALLSIGGLMSMWDVEVGRLPLLLGTAAIYLYAGFGRLGAKETRAVIGVLGMLYLLSGGLLFALSILEGAPLTEHEVRIILTRVLLGASSVFVWSFFRNKLS